MLRIFASLALASNPLVAVLVAAGVPRVSRQGAKHDLLPSLFFSASPRLRG